MADYLCASPGLAQNLLWHSTQSMLECLALCRPSIEPILAYVSATRALPPNIAGAVDTAVLEDFVAEAHDTVALHAMMLWKLGNYAGALSTATECVALLQEHAVPVGPSIGRALCVGEKRAGIKPCVSKQNVQLSLVSRCPGIPGSTALDEPAFLCANHDRWTPRQ
eukprot:1160911-Pelagomonas_calceolata.AAC.10